MSNKQPLVLTSHLGPCPSAPEPLSTRRRTAWVAALAGLFHTAVVVALAFVGAGAVVVYAVVVVWAPAALLAVLVSRRDEIRAEIAKESEGP